MGEATRGESLLLQDLNEFVRQTSDLLEDEPQTSGIRPNPVIEVTETTLDTIRFGFEFGPQPEAQVEPGGGGGPPNTLMGACCFEDGSCSVETAQQCSNDGGTYQGDNSDCTPNPCSSGDTGACCYNGACSQTTEEDCTGAFMGVGSNCDEVECSFVGCCIVSPEPPDFRFCINTTNVDCEGTFVDPESFCCGDTVGDSNCCLSFAPFFETCCVNQLGHHLCCGPLNGVEDCSSVCYDQCICPEGTICCDLLEGCYAPEDCV